MTKEKTTQATIDDLLNGPPVLLNVVSAVLYDTLIIRPRLNTRFSFFRYHCIGMQESITLAQGALRNDSNMVLESDTNMDLMASLAKGRLFAFNRVKVLEIAGDGPGLPLKGELEASTTFQLVIDHRMMQGMLVEQIMEHVFRPTQNIDGLRYFYVDLQLVKPDLWPDETRVRVELHGAWLRPVL